MSDPVSEPVPAAAAPDSAHATANANAKAAKPPGAGFTFTDAGCRTEVRLGALLVLAAVFLWLWLGPERASWLYLVGAPLLLVGVPIQALQAGGRPGFPWKLGIAFAGGAAAMWPGLLYRDDVGDAPLHVQTVVPMLMSAGVWILVWWPVALWRRRAGARP